MEDFSRPQRVWVNQPSTAQQYHKLHGVKGIAVMESYDKKEDDSVTIYFVEGPVFSQRIHKSALAVCKISSAG